jgi:uncharacterized protein (DUF2236 family)
MTQGLSECLERPPNGSVFLPGSIFWQVNREMVSLLAGGRALLMQIAHPKIAAGVAEHSHFQRNPLNRLRRTMDAMWSISFAEPAAACAALHRIAGIHQKVHGVVGPNEPTFAAAPYSALDPQLLLWVHATLIDSAMVAYDNFVAPLSAAEAAQYYDQSKALALLFEIPKRIIPATLPDFLAYLDTMYRGDQIVVGPTARFLARDILYPDVLLLKPAGPLQRLLTAGLLPEKLREGYDLAWNQRRMKRFKLLSRIIRKALPLVPAPIRIVPHARAAERRARMRG